nr:aldo/keto reductase [Sphingomicrobium lutaoense]
MPSSDAARHARRGFHFAERIVGTAQWGLDYGIANRTGLPCENEVHEMMRLAYQGGVRTLDTARAYGDSEERIGRSALSSRFTILTKTPPNMGPRSEDVRSAIEESLSALRRDRLDGLLLHRIAQLAHEQTMQALMDAQANGLIERIGVSVQGPEEMEKALGDERISIIQFAYNLLDNRWESFLARFEKVRKERDLKLHARSALLQGLLLSRDPHHWRMAHVEDPHPIWRWLDNLVLANENRSLAELLIEGVRRLEWIDAVIIGVETPAQLRALLGNRDSSDLIIPADRPSIQPETLNPALWTQAA